MGHLHIADNGTAEAPLAAYGSKRNFASTLELPPRSAPQRGRGQRFVIQKHAARRLHYDLRLEVDGVFRSWAVTRGPSVNPADKRLAVEVEDHPLAYGSFEGPIPRGEYGAGTVQLWDQGSWSIDSPGSAADALRRGELKFGLQGRRLHGHWVLVRMRDDTPGSKRHNWLLMKHRDEYAGTRGDTEALMKLDESVVSGKSLHELAGTRRAQAIPTFVPFQLCTLVDRPPDGGEWVHELKFDGYRMQLRVLAGRAIFRTRKKLDWSARFPELLRAAAGLPDCLLDRRDENPIRYERLNSESGKAVPWKEIVKAFEYSKGNYVVIDDKALKRIHPEATESIEISAFVPRDAITPRFFEKPYYLLPAAKAEKGYVLLREILEKTKKLGIATVVIRTRQYLAAVMPLGNALLLNLMRYPQELIAPEEYSLPSGQLKQYRVSPKEVEMGEALVESMAAEWKPGDYRDDFQDKLRKLVDAQVKQKHGKKKPDRREGKESEPAAAATNVVDFMALLRKSIEGKGKRPRTAAAAGKRSRKSS